MLAGWVEYVCIDSKLASVNALLLINFDFELPSEVLANKSAKFQRKFADRKNLHRYFGTCVI